MALKVNKLALGVSVAVMLSLQSCNYLNNTLNVVIKKLWGEDEREPVDKAPYKLRRPVQENPTEIDNSPAKNNPTTGMLKLNNQYVAFEFMPTADEDEVVTNIEKKDKVILSETEKKQQSMFPLKEYSPVASQVTIINQENNKVITPLSDNKDIKQQVQSANKGNFDQEQKQIVDKLAKDDKAVAKGKGEALKNLPATLPAKTANNKSANLSNKSDLDNGLNLDNKGKDKNLHEISLHEKQESPNSSKNIKNKSKANHVKIIKNDQKLLRVDAKGHKTNIGDIKYEKNNSTGSEAYSSAPPIVIIPHSDGIGVMQNDPIEINGENRGYGDSLPKSRYAK